MCRLIDGCPTPKTEVEAAPMRNGASGPFNSYQIADYPCLTPQQAGSEATEPGWGNSTLASRPIMI